MTRLQKKCFLLSVGVHGLLLVILVGSSAFRDKPATKDIHMLMTMIPANILDKAGVGGGSPEPAAAAPQPPQPAPQVIRTPPTPRPAPAVVRTPQPVERQQPVERVERPKPREVTAEPTLPTLPPKKVAKPTDEIVPDYTPASTLTSRNKPKTSAPEVSDTYTQVASNNHLKQRIAQSLNNLARGVQTSGAAGTVMDMTGAGGGEAFVGYETVIFNAYYHAWVTPDSVAERSAKIDVKIVVARDGTILSADITSKSGESALDKSVERALRVVTKLPAFPAASHDEQRTFLIRFSPIEKEGSG